MVHRLQCSLSLAALAATLIVSQGPPAQDAGRVTSPERQRLEAEIESSRKELRQLEERLQRAEARAQQLGGTLQLATPLKKCTPARSGVAQHSALRLAATKQRDAATKQREAAAKQRELAAKQREVYARQREVARAAADKQRAAAVDAAKRSAAQAAKRSAVRAVRPAPTPRPVAAPLARRVPALRPATAPQPMASPAVQHHKHEHTHKHEHIHRVIDGGGGGASLLTGLRLPNASMAANKLAAATVEGTLLQLIDDMRKEMAAIRGEMSELRAKAGKATAPAQGKLND